MFLDDFHCMILLFTPFHRKSVTTFLPLMLNIALTLPMFCYSSLILLFLDGFFCYVSIAVLFLPLSFFFLWSIIFHYPHCLLFIIPSVLHLSLSSSFFLFIVSFKNLSPLYVINYPQLLTNDLVK